MRTSRFAQASALGVLAPWCLLVPSTFDCTVGHWLVFQSNVITTLLSTYCIKGYRKHSKIDGFEVACQ